MEMHILLIDDDKDEHGIFTDALNQVHGTFNCVYANSAESAMEMLKDTTPDFIFIDYNLPKVNGLQFLSLFHSNSSPGRTRVFLYSTKISEEIKKKAHGLGAAGCLEKTTTINSLANKLKTILKPATQA